jgi:predicted nucleic acid-binding protein
MNVVILDASVATKMFLAVPGHEQAIACGRRYRFSAPVLLLTETSNALWKYVRRGDTSVEECRDALRELENFVDCIWSIDVVTHALRLACKLGHPVYDCTYLALAQMRQLPILSADKRLLSLAQNQLDLEIIDLASISADE